MIEVEELENTQGQMACSCCLILMKIELLALNDLFTTSLRWLVVEFDAIHLLEKLSRQFEGKEYILNI